MQDGRPAWRKSTFCNNVNCVEVRLENSGTVAVRDNKNPHGPLLRFAPEEWTDFIDGIKSAV
ncbi:DUF397 domain-containing protein [Nonomuraea gerenzanensis]|uniref:DUF397 domain-containing protein n=1 Tax=Nonomuraea gerenzanensis TaxID=93944 RepID=A0A1M4E1Y6_9ACTN|nr:DUF397 domain-containing protein [Nonomuraea gerenzanensis]UBU15085.1 DUF397 domain-containing protein [Nonomuraea gerenzanensis]SBO92828.1 hypothetical protein BN4615_P2342 [Nonomuraea gerenzanensis]